MLGRKADPQVESYPVSIHEAANHAETKAHEAAATAKPTRRPHCGCGLDTRATDMTSTIAQWPRGRSERAPYRRLGGPNGSESVVCEHDSTIYASEAAAPGRRCGHPGFIAGQVQPVAEGAAPNSSPVNPLQVVVVTSPPSSVVSMICSSSPLPTTRHVTIRFVGMS